MGYSWVHTLKQGKDCNLVIVVRLSGQLCLDPDKNWYMFFLCVQIIEAIPTMYHTTYILSYTGYVLLMVVL